jgi:hypothetical protein
VFCVVYDECVVVCDTSILVLTCSQVEGLDTREIEALALFLKQREEIEPSFIGHITLRTPKVKPSACGVTVCSECVRAIS